MPISIVMAVFQLNLGNWFPVFFPLIHVFFPLIRKRTFGDQ